MKSRGGARLAVELSSTGASIVHSAIVLKERFVQDCFNALTAFEKFRSPKSRLADWGVRFQRSMRERQILKPCHSLHTAQYCLENKSNDDRARTERFQFSKRKKEVMVKVLAF